MYQELYSKYEKLRQMEPRIIELEQRNQMYQNEINKLTQQIELYR